MGFKALLGSVVAATILVGFSRTASAEPRQGDTYGTISGQVSYGIWTGDDALNLNPFGVGLGVRGGGTFGPGVYVGADFNYFFGEEQSAGLAGVAGGSTRFNVYDLLAEIGYDAWIYRSGVLRPKLGLGVGFFRGNLCASVPIVGVSTCNSDTRNGFDLAPGLQFLHFFGAGFLTAEFRYETMIVDGPNPSAIVLSLGGGAGF